ncbi:MAG: response regulator, partial [Chloroflexi bacterium]|nr:response regulator [Chloroflexota bacterium]
MIEERRFTILNVNDTEANRYALGRTLQRAGFDILEATTGQEALQMAAERAAEIDLILLDINLPDISGLDVCELLKANPVTVYTPVIHISATAIESEDRVLGLDRGADGYLSQSVQPRELIATVNALLRMRSAEKALRESEEQYRSLAESIPHMVWTAAADGEPTFFNDRWYEYTGLSVEESFGGGWTRVLHEDDRSKDLEEWQNAIRTGNIYESAVRLQRASDGAYRWHLARAVPVRSASGRILNWFGTYTDIDDQEQARRELESGESRTNDFLAMLGHELRNPLAPLTAAARLLQEQRQNPDSVQRYAGLIDRQVRFMARLVDDLLDVARISRGRIEIRKEPVSIAFLIREAVESCRPFSEQRAQTVDVSLAADELLVNADPARLQQVIGNLLNNAVKYTNPNGNIWITSERSGQEAVVRVRDSGTGILPDMLPRIFDTFVQADRTLDRSEGGLGIGLTLVKQLVELHGGSVEAHSAGAEQGSEFVIRLPLLLEGTSSSPLPPDPGSPSVGSQRVMIVDDNIDAAESLAELLQLWGHEVSIAYEGGQALEIAAALRPHVVLLDIGLPGMDGYEVAGRMRREVSLNDTLLVALTGYGRDED